MSSELSANLVALNTIVYREVRRFTRIWPQTLLPPAITMVLYFVIFGNLIGRQIGDMGGFTYMEYIVPGLIMMSVITNAYGNVVSSFFGSKFQRSVEELLVSPVSPHTILLGYTIGGVLRGLAVGVIVTLLSLFFTKLQVHHLGITVLVVVLTATIFSLGGFINAVFARNFDDISIIPTFVLDAADLPGRGVLLDQPAAAVLADRVAGQPDPAHGQRLPLRHPRRLRHSHRRGHRLHAAGHRGALSRLRKAAGERARHAPMKRSKA